MHGAAARGCGAYLNFPCDAILERGHVRNHADQPLPAGQLLEHMKRAKQAFLIQRAEAFVDE